jgi:hypothetical protein
MSVGYWRNTAIAIVTLLQLASGTVQAAEKTYTANDLLQDCKDTLLERATFRREIAPETPGHGLPLGKCEAYNRVYDQCCGSS